MLFNTILLALRSIRRNLMRSFLTILGIVIGVSAVITMVTLGNGATLAVQTQISSLGTNLLQVRPGQRMGPGGGTGAPSFKDTDADAIAQQIGGILAVAPEAQECQPDDLEVEGQRPVVDVVEVVGDALADRGLAAEVVDLGPAGDAGPDAVAGHVLRVALAEAGDELGSLGARADERHLAPEDVPELR